MIYSKEGLGKHHALGHVLSRGFRSSVFRLSAPLLAKASNVYCTRAQAKHHKGVGSVRCALTGRASRTGGKRVLQGSLFVLDAIEGRVESECPSSSQREEVQVLFVLTTQLHLPAVKGLGASLL